MTQGPIPPAVHTAFANVLPQGGVYVRAARSEDAARVERMLTADRADWSTEDIDIVMAHAQTTLGGSQTFKWVLPAWLARSRAEPAHGWITDSTVLAENLDRAGFDGWPEAQRAAILPMLAEWLRAHETAFQDDAVRYAAEDDAVLRAWLKARDV